MLLGEERFVAAEVGVREPGTLRELFGDLVPVGVVTGGDEELVVCPGRDHPAGAGDRVTVLGKPEDLAAAELTHAAEPEAPPRQGGGPVRQHLRRASRTLAQGTDRAVGITLIVSLVMLFFFAAILRIGYIQPDGHHLSVGESVHFTVETFATVDFGDFSFAEQPGGMQFFGIVLIIAGVTLSTVVLALITNALVSRRIARSLGQGSIRGMNGHVVLVGLGAVGLRVLEGLRALDRDVVVVEHDEGNRYVQHARSLGAPVVHGDATLGQTLSSVNIREAGAVAILTGDDLVNLGPASRSATRSARAGPRYGSSCASSTAPSAAGSRAPSSSTTSGRPRRSPHRGSSAPCWASRSSPPSTSATAPSWSPASASASLAGLAMRELSARIRVIALERAGADGEMEHPPRRDTRFAASDRAYLLGPYEELLRVLGQEREGVESASPQ